MHAFLLGKATWVLQPLSSKGVHQKIRHNTKDRDNKLFQKVSKPTFNPDDLFQLLWWVEENLIRGLGKKVESTAWCSITTFRAPRNLLFMVYSP